jgi:GNAT superfamily N-acetyltransferase
MTELRKTRPLSEADGPRVKVWIKDWLVRHIAGWAPSYGLLWGNDEIEAHISRFELVEQQWAELVSASAHDRSFVRIFDEMDEVVGIIFAELKEDRYMKIPLGVLSWLYVASERRGAGIAQELIATAQAWHSERGAIATEVFATSSNSSAIRSYAKSGFVPVDCRLVADIENPQR